MTSPRYYSVGTRAALAALSYGTCYWPECSVPIVTLVNRRYRMNLQIAHIRPASVNGPRAAAAGSIDDRDDFANLILLCKPHHEEVDEFPDDYTVDILEDWKRARERGRQTALSNVAEFTTEDGLRQAIVDAIADRDEALESALTRLEQNDQEAAELLREMRDQLAAAREAGHVVDPDSASLTHQAAMMLQHLPDSASVALDAAQSLQSIEGLVATLSAAAKRIESAQQFM